MPKIGVRKPKVNEANQLNFIYFVAEGSVSEGGSSDEDGVEPGLKIFKCEECHKTFKDKKYLKQHVIVHKKDKPFKCFHCPKLFKALKYLKAHAKLSGHALSLENRKAAAKPLEDEREKETKIEVDPLKTGTNCLQN